MENPNLHEYFDYSDSGSVIKVFDRIKNVETPEKKDVTDEVNKDVCNMEKNIEVAPTEELTEAMNLLNEKIDEIQKKRKATGYSNYMHFHFMRIKAKINNELKQREVGIIFKKLHNDGIVNYLINDDSRNKSSEFPDTINEFINLVSPNIVIKDIPEILKGEKNFPILFYTSPEAMEKIKQIGKVHIVTGHCIIGFEPNQDKDEQITECLKKGIGLHDLLVYINLKDIIGTLEEKVTIDGFTINMDSYYYAIKLSEMIKKECKKYKVEDTKKILEDLVESHTKTIKKIFPNVNVRSSASTDYLAELMEIVNGGLLDYIVNEVKQYMGHDLTVEKDMAKALAVTSATYILPIIKNRIPTIAIESALNTENPTGICYTYLKKIGMSDMFSFIGLFPLANTRVSHASMYYGNSTSGKIFVGDSEEEVKIKIENGRRDHESPPYCFVVNYNLSCGKEVPKECNYKLCGLHTKQVINDINELLKKYK